MKKLAGILSLMRVIEERNAASYVEVDKKDMREYARLKKVKLYLESDPSEEFVKKMLDDKERELEVYMGRIEKQVEAIGGSELGKNEHRKELMKLYEIKGIMKQIEMLNFILN